MHVRFTVRVVLSALRGILFLAALVTVASCERSDAEIHETETVNQEAGTHPTATDLAVQGSAARAAGNHEACVVAYSTAASFGLKDDAGYYLYEASRCAARAGDFRSSLFHVYGAASSGFYKLADLQIEPDLRPLHASNRWQLVTDLVAENQRTRAADTGPRTTSPQTTSPPTLCLLVQTVRTRSSNLVRDAQESLQRKTVY